MYIRNRMGLDVTLSRRLTRVTEVEEVRATSVVGRPTKLASTVELPARTKHR